MMRMPATTDIVTTDIAIIGAGIAGATLAAAIGDAARVALIEGEDQPGYHATGRSAAFWSESYGGPAIQPLTTASRAALEPHLGTRRCLHIADGEGQGALDRLAAEFAGRPPALLPIDRGGIEAILPGMRSGFTRGLLEPSCEDIDVAAYHAASLKAAHAAGATLIPASRVLALSRANGRWSIETTGETVRAAIIVDAAGAWASPVAALAGAASIAITPYRRTVVQLVTDPAPSAALPLIMDAAGRFYFKPETGGRLWLSPHDETAVDAHDVAAEEMDVAIAIDRFQQAVDWRIVKRERAWAGLRSFAPDRAPVYGFDARSPGFFWFAGQGGFGIQTAPAAAAIGAALLLGRTMPDWLGEVDAERYAALRFA